VDEPLSKSPVRAQGCAFWRLGDAGLFCYAKAWQNKIMCHFLALQATGNDAQKIQASENYPTLEF
jgi:hypothetical protein